MIDRSWQIEDAGPDQDYDAGRPPVLVTLHYLRAALRRKWKACLAAACAGALLGLGLSLMVPAASVGTVTVLLAHDPAHEPTLAMATDISLLRTRTVAAEAVDRLDLRMTPQEFQESVTVVADTPSILVITVTGLDDRDAATRARELGKVFLEFRRSQLEGQAVAMVEGYEERVAALGEQVRSLTEQYAVAASGGPGSTTEASELLSQRSQVTAEITRLQQVIEDTSLEASAVVAASHVLDPASAVPRSTTRRTVLATGSGLIGGLALGVGLVVVSALSSDRLRRREEVSLALGVPVRASVGRLRVRAGYLPGARRRASGAGLQVLLHALDPLFARTGGSQVRAALLSVDNAEEAELLTAAAAARLAQRGHRVLVADLGRDGHVSQKITKLLGKGPQVDHVPAVFRPEGVPQLARGPLGRAAGLPGVLPDGHPRRRDFDAAADVVLTLLEVDPAVGVEELGTWADRAALLVTAGRSSAERLRTTAELVRAAGIEPELALLVGADRVDESPGVLRDEDAPSPARERSVSS